MNANSPNFMHRMVCDCQINSAKMPCYVWIHYPVGPGKVRRFADIHAAYTFAHEVAIDHIMIPTLTNEDGKLIRSYPPEFLYNNGQFLCEVDWTTYLCDIIADLKYTTQHDKMWSICAGDSIQVALGLGYLMPANIIDTFCRDDPVIYS